VNLLELVMVTLVLTPTSAGASDGAAAPRSDSRFHDGTAHDFDFLSGRWRVHHRRLKSRLTHSNEWEVFTGTCEARAIMDGQGNIDDNVLDLPGGTYRAATLRAFDSRTRTWVIWWLDGRNPQHLDPPVTGSFERGVGTFYGSDSWEGKPILVRFIWSEIAADSARWEQAFSGDRGMTWETNWIMEFRRSSE
jgi:hypothetical protein